MSWYAFAGTIEFPSKDEKDLFVKVINDDNKFIQKWLTLGVPTTIAKDNGDIDIEPIANVDEYDLAISFNGELRDGQPSEVWQWLRENRGWKIRTSTEPEDPIWIDEEWV